MREPNVFMWSFMLSEMTSQCFRTGSSTSRVLMRQLAACGGFLVITTTAVRRQHPGGHFGGVTLRIYLENSFRFILLCKQFRKPSNKLK